MNGGQQMAEFWKHPQWAADCRIQEAPAMVAGGRGRIQEVPPRRLELRSLAPEASTLSTELRGHLPFYHKADGLPAQWQERVFLAPFRGAGGMIWGFVGVGRLIQVWRGSVLVGWGWMVLSGTGR